MTALQVEFVDFPDDPKPTLAELTAEFADVLRANPGRWAKWPVPMAPRSARTRAAGINHQRQDCPKAVRGGGFEARTQAGVLYVRYIGPAA